VGARDAQSGRAQLIGPLLPNEERDISPGLKKPRSQVSASRAGPYHKQTHHFSWTAGKCLNALSYAALGEA
jgi:hypothetical protein